MINSRKPLKGNKKKSGFPGGWLVLSDGTINGARE